MSSRIDNLTVALKILVAAAGAVPESGRGDLDLSHIRQSRRRMVALIRSSDWWRKGAGLGNAIAESEGIFDDEPGVNSVALRELFAEIVSSKSDRRPEISAAIIGAAITASQSVVRSR